MIIEATGADTITLPTSIQSTIQRRKSQLVVIPGRECNSADVITVGNMSTLFVMNQQLMFSCRNVELCYCNTDR